MKKINVSINGQTGSSSVNAEVNLSKIKKHEFSFMKRTTTIEELNLPDNWKPNNLFHVPKIGYYKTLEEAEKAFQEDTMNYLNHYEFKKQENFIQYDENNL